MNRFILGLSFVLMVITSCEQYIGGDINADPNRPLDVPVQSMMPSILMNAVEFYAGDVAFQNELLAFRVEPLAYRSIPFVRLIHNQVGTFASSSFLDRVWSRYYTSILNETRIAKAKCDEVGLHNHKAILLIVEAFSLFAATDVWGDMPYYEAVSGVKYPNPRYDTQQEILEMMLSLLDEAEMIISGSAIGSDSDPVGSEDMVHGGDMDRWRHVIDGLRARYYLRIVDYDQALHYAQRAFDASDDDFGFRCPGASVAAPWYRLIRDRTGDVEFDPGFRSFMQSYGDDPRLDLWDHHFNVQHPWMTADMEVSLMSYTEMQFVIAECALRRGLMSEAYEAYLRGIESSFEMVGLDDQFAGYASTIKVSPGPEQLTLEHILDQKFIALYLTPESYADKRRTLLPSFSGQWSSSDVLRWPYPLSEKLYNRNAPEDGSINPLRDRVWWNK